MSSRIMDTLLGKRSAEDASRPLTDASLIDLLGGGWGTDSGVTVTPENAYRMLAVFRCVALLAGLVGALPLHAYARKPDGRREPYRSALIDNPNPDLTPFDVWEYVGQSLLTHGNAYVYKARDGMGRVQELWPQHPNDWRVERKKAWRTDDNPSGKRFFEKGQVDRWYTGGVAGDILHIPGLSYDGTVGLSPIAQARQAIGVSLAAEAFGARMFERGALTQGVLETEQPLEEPTAKRLQERWRQKTAGAGNQWRIPVLDAGAKYKPITLPPADVQMLESRKFGVTEIARLYGVPPHLVGDVERSTSWGSGIEQQNLQLLIFTLDPNWLVRIEQRVTKELLPAGRYAKYNRAAILRADTSTRYMAYQRAIQNGLMSPDEARELEDTDPVPAGKGDRWFVPSNLQELGADEPEPEPDPPPADDEEDPDAADE